MKGDHRVRCNVWVCQSCLDGFEPNAVVGILVTNGPGSDVNSKEESQQQLDSADEDSDPDASEVVHVLEVRNSREDGENLQFLIQWSGRKEHTWEDEADLECPKLLDAFWASRRKVLDAGLDKGTDINFASDSDDCEVPRPDGDILWADVVGVVQEVELAREVDVKATKQTTKTSVDDVQPTPKTRQLGEQDAAVSKMETTQLGEEDANVLKKAVTEADAKAMQLPNEMSEEVKQERRSPLPLSYLTPNAIGDANSHIVPCSHRLFI